MNVKISLEQLKYLLECAYAIRDLTQDTMELDMDIATTLNYYDTVVQANLISKAMLKGLEEKADRVIAHHNYTKKKKGE